MKKCKNRSPIIAKKILAIFIALYMVLVAPTGITMVNASQEILQTEETIQSESTVQSESTAETTTNTDPNGTLGKNSEVGIEVAKAITGKAGKEVKVAFILKSADAETIKLKAVYPVIDASFPFETSGDAYKVISAGSDTDKQTKLSAEFKLKARSDIETGYHSVRFIGEYAKIASDGTASDYYVIKTINVYLEGKSVSTGNSTNGNTSNNNNNTYSPDDDDDDDDSDHGYSGPSYSDNDSDSSEATAPKLVITGYDTKPETIMAGETFKITIHIQNTSKSTPVCNGKFLIGNEAGNFLPTSGSSAVYVESIPAGETGDIEIEMRTASDLAQKNYILVVKGDFDDGKGNNFTSSDNLSIPVYQEVRLGISDVTMTPEELGVGFEGSLMFTINNQGNAGVYNVKVAVQDDAVTAEDVYVGNIAASSSAYATLNVTGAKDNTDSGTIKVVISYEDATGNEGKMEESIACVVGESVEMTDSDWGEELDPDYEDESSGLPIWLIILLILLAIIVVVAVVVILVQRKKKRLAQLLEDEDEFDEEEFGGEFREDDIENEDF